MGSVLTGIKKFILWDYSRASWQYDVMVGLILAFLFLTPREWFRDQPRVPQASEIAMPKASPGTKVFWIEAEALAGVPESEWEAKAVQILNRQTGKAHTVIRLDPVLNSEKEIKGFMAVTRS